MLHAPNCSCSILPGIMCKNEEVKREMSGGEKERRKKKEQRKEERKKETYDSSHA